MEIIKCPFDTLTTTAQQIQPSYFSLCQRGHFLGSQKIPYSFFPPSWLILTFNGTKINLINDGCRCLTTESDFPKFSS